MDKCYRLESWMIWLFHKKGGALRVPQTYSETNLEIAEPQFDCRKLEDKFFQTQPQLHLKKGV